MSPEELNLNRRHFLKTSAIAATGLSFGLKPLEAPSILAQPNGNSKIGVGFIGIGNRGSDLMHLFMAQPDVKVVALCDVYEPYIYRDRSKVAPRFIEIYGGKVPRMGEQFDQEVGRYTDFRKMLEHKGLDAVVIATPDHWHAIQTIMACDAGKDVYVEKPLTITIHEGRKMVEAAQRTNRVVAVGLNRRGSTVYQHLAQQVQNGAIGKVCVGLAGRVSNMYPDGIGKYQSEEPPPGLNWDMWLGPREVRPFQYNITPYMFRWWKAYSSQMGNWGVHYMDVIRWLINEKAPLAITAHGGKYVLNDDRTIPDTMEVIFEFASGAIVKFSINEASSGNVVTEGEIELHGTRGNLFASERHYKIVPGEPGQFQNWQSTISGDEKKVSDLLGAPDQRENSTANLVRNFLDCVKSRKTPLCSLEEGHRSTTFAHLANIALEMRSRIEWNPEKEMITNLPEVNKLLHYEYRKPWKLG